MQPQMTRQQYRAARHVMRPRPYTPPPPARAPVISLGSVRHVGARPGAAALSGGGWRVALIKPLRGAR